MNHVTMPSLVRYPGVLVSLHLCLVGSHSLQFILNLNMGMTKAMSGFQIVYYYIVNILLLRDLMRLSIVFLFMD